MPPEGWRPDEQWPLTLILTADQEAASPLYQLPSAAWCCTALQHACRASMRGLHPLQMRKSAKAGHDM